MQLQQRIEARGRTKDAPARILSLDGGGIRGLITLGYLHRIEEILKAKSGKGNAFRLRDHYDLIGGASTGAIIAAGLAVGLTVQELIDNYLKLGERIFKDPGFFGRISGGLLAPKFRARDVDEVLEPILRGFTLGEASITTGLCIVMKRFDTNSAWPVVNAPKSKYYEHPNQPNKHFVLRNIVRASTAAPTYFDAELVTLGATTYGFIDGGVSMHNNPGLQLFEVATLKGFGFDWKPDFDTLKMVSIGTGDWPRGTPIGVGAPGTMPLSQVKNLVGMLMEDASAGNETVLQALGHGRNRRFIDRVIEKVEGNPWGPPKLGYERLQVELTEPFFRAYGLDSKIARIDGYREMDNIKYMDDLLEIGQVAAARDVLPEDLV